jgi:hypothetical protein
MIAFAMCAVLAFSPAEGERGFCEGVTAGGGCCPACNFAWDQASASCTTSSKPTTTYCKLLHQPQHNGCCGFCGFVWSTSASKCVKEDALEATPTASTESPEATPPKPTEHVAFARWMSHKMTWGTLSTTAARTEGTVPGTAFGNPYSFADVDGVPYFYGAGMDGSMIDAFNPSSLSSRGSLSLSEASLQGDDSVKACAIGQLNPLGDPENPPCARLVLSGNLSKVEAGSSEETVAKAALFAKHPSFKFFPPGHAFFVAKLSIDGVWLIDAYGGAATPAASEYLSFNSTR